MIIENTRKDSKVIWQETHNEDLTIPESALLIEAYEDILVIMQEGRCINLNYSTIPGLCKLLKELSKNNETNNNR